ncbi:MAG: SLC13 family permease, partial [Kiloniellales bacterium]|nr:SLC13 family permease [Kiloniellales bacterium]
GIVPPEKSFSGFGHPATITVAAVLILSRVLALSGALDPLMKILQPIEGNRGTHIAGLSGLGAALSTVMNNVGTLGLLMPLAVQSAKRLKRPAGLLLMPLSFGTILGGLITMIGTPPNIIIAAYREEVAGTPFQMFDFTPVGFVTAVAGISFVALIGWRLVPLHGSKEGTSEDLFQVSGYTTELEVPKKNPNILKTIGELDEASSEIDIVIVDLIRGKKRFPGTALSKEIHAGDILKVQAGAEDLDRFISLTGFELAHSSGKPKEQDPEEDLTLMEAVIKPGSRLDGQVVGRIRLLRNRNAALLAVSREGLPFRGRLKNFRLRSGDVLLLHGPAEQLPDATSAAGCLPLAQRNITFGRRQDGWPAVVIFAAAIAAAGFGILPITIAFALAIVFMVLTNVLPVREIYEGIEWPVIVLLAALIPIGGAMESTGATDLIAGTVVALSGDWPAWALLLLVMVVTMTLSDLLNNAATAVVMAPIGVKIAGELQVSPDPFLMAVAVAASCAFLTPIGHQNNALIMGPGRFHFGDYWPMGLPLEIVVVSVSLPMILWVWPL